MMRKYLFYRWMPLPVVLLTILLLPAGLAASEVELSRGQTLYVSIYSHVYGGDRERPVLLTAILSIRNTDPTRSIRIKTIDYYDSQGKRIKKYIDRPVVLKPLASTRYIVPESDSAGGSGANFIVRWEADAEVNNAIVEGIMIGTKMQQGISFVSRGQVIKEK